MTSKTRRRLGAFFALVVAGLVVVDLIGFDPQGAVRRLAWHARRFARAPSGQLMQPMQAPIVPSIQESERCLARWKRALSDSFEPPRYFDASVDEAFREAPLEPRDFALILCALGESPLVAPNEGARVRLTIVPGLSRFVSTVRVSHSAVGTQLTATELDTADLATRHSVERTLTDAEWSTLHRVIEESAAWHISPGDDEIGADGEDWLLELAESDRYHVVLLWDFERIKPIGDELRRLSVAP